MAIQLHNGEIITGKESDILTAPSAAFLNVIKYLAKIPDEVYLLSPTVLESIFKMKQKTSYYVTTYKTYNCPCTTASRTINP